MKMPVYIPSYSRSQATLAGTLRSWPKRRKAFLVVRPEQMRDYEKLLVELGHNTNITVLTIGLRGIAKTRNAILKHAWESGYRKVCMIDDDLQFLIRRDDHDWKLRGATDKEIGEMLRDMERWLSKNAHCAISCREGNNRETADHADSTRGIRIVAYNLEILNRHSVMFRTTVEGREDLDMTLRLLRLGYPNRVFFKYAQGQRTSGDRGGLEGSPARTFEKMKETAERLARYHEGFVKVVKKTTKGSWGGGERYDVRISWKRALASAGKKTA